ncbi:MAG TPA: response regulator transcription factor [Thioalkalivibrio sp.]|nr:response regulator transcription factor [Thioalkalivibrio sp.]
MGTILVVDDEPVVASVIQRCLSRHDHEVYAAGDAAEAVGLAVRIRPDLAILDINMPGMDGLALCRELRAMPMLEGMRVLFLTERDAVAERVEGLDAGADDYLPKPFDLDELSARVRALLRRGQPPAPADEHKHILSAGEVALDTAARAAVVGGRRVALTPVEFDLLTCLLNHAGEVLSPEQLLQRVWGYAPGTGDSGLVRWHIKQLRDKIEPDPGCPRVIRTVPGHGYVLTGAA